jgi:hypothetical protein
VTPDKVIKHIPKADSDDEEDKEEEKFDIIGANRDKF